MPHIIDTVQFKRASPARWAQLNPILPVGEPGYERNTGRFKIGDGVRPWNELDYFTPTYVEPTPVTNLVDHVYSDLPHPAYDDGPSFTLIYENAKV